MTDLVEKIILSGLGVLTITRKKAEEIAQELIKEGELCDSDEAKFVKDLMEKTKSSKTEIEEKIEKVVEKTLMKLNIPTQKELKQIDKKIDKLLKK